MLDSARFLSLVRGLRIPEGLLSDRAGEEQKVAELHLRPRTGFSATPTHCLSGRRDHGERKGEAMRGSRTLPGMSLCFIGALAVLCAAAGCGQPSSDRFQGYVEGEFVYVASPLSGILDSLEVCRGERVEAEDTLFALDSTVEKAALDEAERRLAQARATLEDARKGKRPSEIEAIRAQLGQAQAALALSEKELTRQANLVASKASPQQALDRARTANDQNRQLVAQLEADLKTAHLGSRADQIVAAQANMRALEAALAKPRWDLSRKSRTAPRAGLVFDTLYREGEWVAAGQPVVVLLPPQNIKVRAFIPETRIGTVRPGDAVRVTVDGVSEPFAGKVSFISPRAEFTPPVIYSRESRSKLVFMIEVAFDPQTAANLHPGQPVDVRFGS